MTPSPRRGGAAPRRPAFSRLRLACAAALAGALWVGPAPAAEPPAARPEQIEAVFVEALAQIDAGEARRAVPALRALLARDPSLTRVRLELARAYFVIGDFDQARDAFFTVLSGDIPPGVRASVLGFIRAIDARRGWDWSLDVRLAPSIGPGRRAVTDTLPLVIDGQTVPFTLRRDPEPAFTVVASGGVEVRARLGAGPGGSAAAGFAAVRADIEEAPGARDDDHLLSVRAGTRLIWPRTTATLNPFVSHRWLGGDPFERRAGAEAAAETRAAAGLSVFGGGFGARVDNRRDPGRDGAIGGLRAGLAQSLGGRAALGGVLRVERLEADAAFERYTELRADLFATADLGRGVGARLGAFALTTGFDARAPLFANRRRDREVGADLRLSRLDVFLLGAFSPFVEVGASRRRSTIAAFGYDELRVGFGVFRAL